MASRTGLLTWATIAAVLVPATGAAAHPGLRPNELRPGETIEAELIVPHGCGTEGERPEDAASASPTVEVAAEIFANGPVLTVWAVAKAVGQDRLQAIERVASDVRVLVDDDSGNVLPDSLSHDPRLAVVDGKAFLYGSRARVKVESLRSTFELGTA